MFGSMADFEVAVRRMALAFIPLALGIIVHEVAHGWMAWRKGDPTAAQEGRLTLNPLPHVDPMGLLAFVLTSLSGPFVFGWAKPVPVDYRNLRNPLKDMMIIAAAGPVSNMCLAVAFALAVKLMLWLFPPAAWHANQIWHFFSLMLPMGITINCALAWLNLLPIPPLDGSKILTGVLPYRFIGPYLRLERYGFMLLILLLMTGILGKILYPLIGLTLEAVVFIVGLS
ncbi:MAG: site-2 protease family protein [Deltaproteobacteria bacterium]|jgi:Zn-dependent protease|nr:site-2 protease family protein [Deltaproteobacteria bacterium]